MKISYSLLRWLSRLSLRTQLVTLMLALMGTSFSISYWVTNRIERAALNEIQEYFQTLSRAVEVSIRELQLTETPDTGKLALQAGLRSGILREITLLTPEGKVIASAPLIEASGDGEPKPASGFAREVEVNIPVIPNGQLSGYIRLKIALANFGGLFQDMLLSKVYFSILLFVLGSILVFPIAGFLVGSTRELNLAARSVAQGNLSVKLPNASNREIASLNASFDRMVKKLLQQKELEVKFAKAEREAVVGRMASGIAHDIRNPLNYVSLAVQQLRSDFYENSGEKQLDQSEELFDGILSELRRISEIMQDLLDFGRPRVPNLETVSPVALLEDCIEGVTRRHSKEVLDIVRRDSGDCAQLQADPKLLRRALANIIENALEVNPSGKSISVGCRLESQDRVIIWIEDSGPGIPETDLEKIFTPYFTTKASGVGLGLALTAKWIHEMGGEIKAGNGVDGGARFEITLPTTEAPA